MAKKEEIFEMEDGPGVGKDLPAGGVPESDVVTKTSKSKTAKEDVVKEDVVKEDVVKEDVVKQEQGQIKEAGGPPDTEGLPDDDEIYEEDFTGVEEGGFPFVPKGFYHAKVQDMEKNLSQAGNPQYSWKFKIIAGPPDVKGVTLRFWTSLLPQSRWKVVETLEALGVKASGSIARFHKKDVLGAPCIIQTVEEPYEGRMTSKIQKVFKPSEKTLKAVEDLKEDIPF